MLGGTISHIFHSLSSSSKEFIHSLTQTHVLYSPPIPKGKTQWSIPGKLSSQSSTITIQIYYLGPYLVPHGLKIYKLKVELFALYQTPTLCNGERGTRKSNWKYPRVKADKWETCSRHCALAMMDSSWIYHMKGDISLSKLRISGILCWHSLIAIFGSFLMLQFLPWLYRKWALKSVFSLGDGCFHLLQRFNVLGLF